MAGADRDSVHSMKRRGTERHITASGPSYPQSHAQSGGLTTLRLCGWQSKTKPPAPLSRAHPAAEHWSLTALCRKPARVHHNIGANSEAERTLFNPTGRSVRERRHGISSERNYSVNPMDSTVRAGLPLNRANSPPSPAPRSSPLALKYNPPFADQ